VEPPSFWTRLRRGWRRIRQRADWAGFAGPAWPDRIMQVAVTDRFHEKQGRSSGRWQLPAADGSGKKLVVYLKRHYALPLWRGLLALVWPGGNWSPAMAEYEHLEWARKQGVPVPATVAAGEHFGPWGKLQSYLAVEELTDMLPLNEAIPLAMERMPPDTFRRWKAGLVAEMARLARLLHDRRHFHKDLYLCHFFIHQDDLNGLPGPDASAWRGKVVLIDLHRLAHHPWTWWQWQLKDLAQLLYSSDVPGVDSRDQLAFWMHYRGPGAQRWSSRWLRRLVVFKWRRYARHNQRRKRRMKDEG
jgi:heptose I phosphotransferase